MAGQGMSPAQAMLYCDELMKGLLTVGAPGLQQEGFNPTLSVALLDSLVCVREIWSEMVKYHPTAGGTAATASYSAPPPMNPNAYQGPPPAATPNHATTNTAWNGGPPPPTTATSTAPSAPPVTQRFDPLPGGRAPPPGGVPVMPPLVDNQQRPITYTPPNNGGGGGGGGVDRRGPAGSGARSPEDERKIGQVMEITGCTREKAIQALSRESVVDNMVNWVMNSPANTETTTTTTTTTTATTEPPRINFPVIPPPTNPNWNPNARPPAATTPVAPKPAAPPKSTWNCDKCSLENSPVDVTCTVCMQGQRPAHIEADLKAGRIRLTPQEKSKYDAQERENQQLRAFLDQEKQDADRTRNANRAAYERALQAPALLNTKAEMCGAACFMEAEPGDAVFLRSCGHVICKTCLTGMVTANVNDNTPTTCPYMIEGTTERCPGMPSDTELKALLDPELFARWESRALDQGKADLSRNNATFSCTTPNCKGFCVYVEGVNEFPCELCQKTNCLNCKVIHEGKNCKQYQDDLKIAAQNNDALRKDQEYFEQELTKGQAMRCPNKNCAIVLVQNGGCNWLQCTCCKTEICWATKKPRRGEGNCGGGHNCH